MRPERRTEWTAGTPALGSGSRRRSRTRRSFPLRSVTSMSPFGSHARLQGCHSPDAIVVGRTAVALAFLAFSLPCGWPNRPVGSIKARVNAPAENTASIRDCIRRDITRSYFSQVLLQKVGDLGDARLGARVVHLLAGPGAAYAADGVI